MLQATVGNASAEKLLLFMAARESGYASEIAQTFDTDVTTVKNQPLERKTTIRHSLVQTLHHPWLYR